MFVTPDEGVDTRGNDMAPDTAPATIPGCASCASDELCVVYLDGTCLYFGARCAKKTADCQTPMCSAACMALCNPPDAGSPNFSCFSVCPNSPLYAGRALICYGP
jgi:hypothetical protein